MAKASKLDRVVYYTLMNVFRAIRVRWATKVYLHDLKKWDVKFDSPSAYFCYQTS